MTKIKEGIAGLDSDNRLQSSKALKEVVGRVYGVVTNETTPTKELFTKVGGWNGLGTVFYLDYEQTSNVTQVNLNECKIARPLFPNSKYYPVLGELIVIIDLPSPSSQLSPSQSQKYYIIPINVWNNNHHNAMPASSITSFGKSFIEKSNINTIQPYEGDHILESRFGATLRFGSTNRLAPWGKTGEEGDPITILSNGHKYSPKSTVPYIEDINTDSSGVYLTSTQTINFKTIITKYNPLTKPIEFSKYTNGQSIIVGNRVVINSNRDDVLVVAKTNIEFYTKQIINLNAEDRVHLHTPKVFLGTKTNGELPDEPLLLGDKSVDLLDRAFQAIADFASSLSEAISTPQGTPLLSVNSAAHLLSTRLEEIMKQTESIKSKQNFTV
jgi:hypothetical protein